MWLYDGNEHVGPIHINDDMSIGCSYQFLIDVCKANATYLKGVKAELPDFTYRKAIEIELRNYIDMVVENTWEEFNLCADAMAKELERRYAE